MTRYAAALSLALLASPALAESGTLKNGELATHPYEITADDRSMTVHVHWRDPGAEFDAMLVSPKGTTLRGSIPGLSFQKKPYLYELKLDPRLAETAGWAGTWTLTIRCLATHRK